MLSTIPMAPDSFFSIATSFATAVTNTVTNTISGLRNDYQQGADSAREPGVLLSPDSHIFSETNASHATDRAESDAGLSPSTRRDVGNETPDDAIGASRSSPSERRISPSEIELLRETIRRLAEVDNRILETQRKEHEVHSDDVSEVSQRQTVLSAERSQIRNEGSHTSSWNFAEALSIIRKIEEEPAEKRTSPEPEISINSLVGSRLHAGELLTPSIRQWLQAMFTALILQLSCCDKKHFIRLKLTGFVNPFDDKSRPFFDLYLSTGHDVARSSWVESKCTFIRELTQREEKVCTFIQNSIRDKKKMSLFLKDICNQEPETQKTTLEENTQKRLGSIQLGIAEKSDSSATPIVSLASLLKQSESFSGIRQVSNAEKFLPNEQDWLCLNLALSLLHMSGRHWNRPIWYSSDPKVEAGIFFLRDPSTQRILDKTRPYTSWRVQEKPEFQEPTQKCHYDTQLLDFASLLIEIRKWKRLDLKFGTAKQEERRYRLLEYINKNFRPADKEFVSALEACLNQAGYVEAAAKDKPERIQAYVFENIVKPLHRYLGNPELPKYTLMAMPWADEAALDNLNLSENDTSIYDVSVQKDKPPKRDPYEKKFWSNMKIFTEECISPLQQSPLSNVRRPWPEERVRIAIIDSGVRKEDAKIAAANIRECRNFTSSKDCEDPIGHGTMVARLVSKVAPEADLYIAKVSTKHSIPKNQLHHIAEAIKWAVVDCDVDIISISLALSEEHYDIDKELNQALKPTSRDAKEKLVFAAAGNWGAYKSRAWPARKQGVIAVHATDGSGKGTKFNPNPQNDLNISTLGKNIEMKWPDLANPGKYKKVYISGSSFATPIAAGIAANILEFARHKLELSQPKKNRLYSHHGMVKILKEMSNHRGDYDFLHPLDYWEKAIRGGDLEGLTLPKDNSENICEVLNYILD